MTRKTAPPARGGLFSNQEPAASHATYRANIDGGSRGNPGPASYGVVIRDPRGEIVACLKKYIGRTTNNVAEYYGLIAALDYVHAHGVRALRIESDSELLVKQMRGQYKVKSADLRPLFEHARKLSQALEFFRIEHVYRQQNQEADALANEAMDEASGKPPVTTSAAGGWKLPSPQIIEKRGVQKVRAVFRNGALHPAEPVELDENETVQLTISRSAKRE